MSDPAAASPPPAGRPSWARTLLRVGFAAAVGAALGTRIARWLHPGPGAHAPGGAGSLGFSVPVYVSIGLWPEIAERVGSEALLVATT